jgi:hypothetical protein
LVGKVRPDISSRQDLHGSMRKQVFKIQIQIHPTTPSSSSLPRARPVLYLSNGSHIGDLGSTPTSSLPTLVFPWYNKFFPSSALEIPCGCEKVGNRYIHHYAF